MAKEGNENRMIWVDLEMSGLDPDSDHILEMACIVTEADLTIVAEGPHLIIHQPDTVLDKMDTWCTEHHCKSGLTEAVKRSDVSLQEAEARMLTFVKDHTPAERCPLAGNTIHMDRVFLKKHMPNFTKHLHYRIVDVSTLKELCRRWYPKASASCPEKKLAHRALDDIKESIEELRYYRKKIFRAFSSE